MSDEPTILNRARHALGRFLQLEASAGILLIGAALVALAWANSPLAATYDGIRGVPVAVQFGALKIAKPLLLWINDGLMAIFFLLVALELKREALSGQLSTPSQLSLPVLCALAGVAVPAAIYAWINRGDPQAMQGWAVPAATDIAFALGILSLLGSRVPVAMKLLLSTIAVIDDLAAIIIIALFYTSELSVLALAWAGAAIAAMVVLNRRGVQALTPYLLLGLVAWVAVLKSGVHATLAGVATGLLIPHLDRKDAIDDETQHSPLETLEHALHPWVAYLILPVFAFANAGLALGGFALADVLAPVPLGVALGLVLGKPVGVLAAAGLARASGIARFPEGMDWKAMVGLGLLCGIGFTMSLFIASLAFADDGGLFPSAVLGVLCASLVSALAGYAWLRVTLPPGPSETAG
ncbi:Na+/H+ antiporter NhaA [Thermomonas sp.]|jgi:NhaA family Na+:H+ antiporter|uniref:Na+/H+ antiporter NhaA n=1 Tax=Thermomonas sp. TaxID=1971895 RepID=UPI001B6455A8|nr:Na+/H+ antiporter NhaA [Thermomonas sp.]MBK6333725.1 Na+/H+ antiporter NhaA [Thermomonas sp.]MBK6415953.1 Na+/H+ antiporter NhaA [Thermomonas sp.]MBK6925517.1 Na+/H+ antiporter NhaA [Thermomonas sp.]MBK7205129.1 Na+/H+ antiporter NhaA [Thermomonas sp.]MBK9669674.1 Na+/H+ antiporter NhaA [Thermomonas sp.]